MDFSDSPIAAIIFITTIGISLYTMYRDHNLLNKWILYPYQTIREQKYYQLITSGFLHADLNHLLFNMFTFFFFAFNLERIIGSLDFAIIYFLSMLAGNLFTLYKQKDNYQYASLGASGAISGVLFSYILINPSASILIFPIPFPIPSWLFGIIYLGWTYYSSKRNYDNTNHYAHLFGALCGILLTILLTPDLLANF